jgi:hypothetical protein
MAELGRLGGSVRPTTKLRKNADDDLREQARETLSRALRGEDVPKQALDAARSLFSYRADAPPTERQQDAGPLVDAGQGCGLADVLVFAMTANASTREVAEEAIAQAQAAVAGAPPAAVREESRSSETPRH